MMLIFSLSVLCIGLFSVLAAPAPNVGCSDVIVIFARGTLEVPPIGEFVGPQFRKALAAALPGKTLAFKGVDYVADIKGFLEGGDHKGSKRQAEDLEDAAAACPKAALVTSGYRCVISYLSEVSSLFSAPFT
jgi:hypothetical protein